MKALQYSTLMMALVAWLMLPGCTRNNGSIGDWFGTWRLETILIDGTPDADYPTPDIFFKFQNNILCQAKALDDEHRADNRYATWQQIGDILRVDFTHHDDRYPTSGTGLYEPLPALHLPAGQVVDFDIADGPDGSNLTLIYHSPEGSTFTYIFKKWG